MATNEGPVLQLHLTPRAHASPLILQRFMSEPVPYIPARAPHANIAAIQKIQCAGGTCQGAAGVPTYLKQGAYSSEREDRTERRDTTSPKDFARAQPSALHSRLPVLAASVGAMELCTGTFLAPPSVGSAGTKDLVLFRIGVVLQIGIGLGFIDGLYKVRRASRASGKRGL
jgi:hypothetical protein